MMEYRNGQGTISSIHDAAHQRFGAGKIAAKLKDEGVRVSKEMVHELMLEMGLSSIRTKAKALYKAQLRQMRNIVMRNFNISAPNMTWVSDVTEFHYKNVTVHICVVMDLFSRKVVGCKFAYSNNTHLLKMTFRQAYDSRHPGKGLVFHSDRGGNYRSRSMRLMLMSLGVEQSFSRSHVPYDNSVAEVTLAASWSTRKNASKTKGETDLSRIEGSDFTTHSTGRGGGI